MVGQYSGMPEKIKLFRIFHLISICYAINGFAGNLPLEQQQQAETRPLQALQQWPMQVDSQSHEIDPHSTAAWHVQTD